jgi:arsenate reductase
MAPKKRVLVLCTGNSARSQMAQGLITRYLGDAWEAYSAGTRPAGYVHPLAIAVMREIGIDIAAQASKSVEVYYGQPFDLVLTVCGDAAETCPLWLGQGKVVHIGFSDPAAATGDDAARLQVFRATRDLIQQRVLDYLARFDQEEPTDVTGPFKP